MDSHTIKWWFNMTTRHMPVVAAKQERALQTAEKDAQRVDMLKFQLQEIEEANIYVGKEEQLSEEKNTSRTSKNQTALQTALAALEGRIFKRRCHRRSDTWSGKPRVDFNKL